MENSDGMSGTSLLQLVFGTLSSDDALFLVSPHFVRLYCTFIVLGTAIVSAWFIIRWLRLRGEVNHAIRRLAPPLPDANVHDLMNGSRLLSSDWQTFSDTMEYRTDLNRWVRLDEPEMYFRFESIVPRVMMKGFYDALPAILTGLGILGTFLGLTGGIYLAQSKIALSDITEVRAGLNNLLSGAALAFLTSVSGILMSLLFTGLKIAGFNTIASKITELNQHIKRITTRIPPEMLVVTRLEQAFRETSQQAVTDLSRLLTSGIQDSIAPILREQERQTGQFQSVSHQLSHPAGQILWEWMGSSLQNITSLLEDIRDTRETANQELLRTMIDDFRKSLSGTAGLELRELGRTMESFKVSMESTIDGMQAAQQLMSQSMTELSQSIKTAIDHSVNNLHSEIRDVVSAVLFQFQNAGATLSSQLQTSGSATLSLLNQSVSVFQSTLDSFAGMLKSLDQIMINSRDTMTLTDSTTRQLVQLRESFQNITKPAEEICMALIKNNSLANQTYSKLQILSETMVNTVKNGAALQEKLSGLWEQYPGRFDKVDRDLRVVFDTIEMGVKNFMAQIQKYMIELDRHLGLAIRELAGVVSEIHDTVTVSQNHNHSQTVNGPQADQRRG